jgi:hypothetical protein
VSRARTWLLAAVILASGWALGAAGAQSAIQAPFFREVNSEAILAALGGLDVTGELDVNITGVSGVAPLAVANTGTLQSAVVANGDGSTLSTNGYGVAVLTVNCATCSGGTLVNFEGTEDGTNYVAISSAQRLGSVATIGASTSVAGLTYWRIPVAGFQNIRARVSAYSAGTVTVTGRALLYATAPVVALNEPCETEVKQTTSFSTAEDAIIVPLVAGKTITICDLSFVTSAAEIVSFTAGTGTDCATSESAVFGNDGTTDANGMSFGANSGMKGIYIAMPTAAEDLCMILGGTNRVSGGVTWVAK